MLLMAVRCQPYCYNSKWEMTHNVARNFCLFIPGIDFNSYQFAYLRERRVCAAMLFYVMYYELCM